MALFDIVDKNLPVSLSAASETLNTAEGSSTRYTLTAEVDHLTQEELTAKILAMIQGDNDVQEILKEIKAEIQKEEITNLSTVEERNAEVRRIRDEQLNAWAKEIQEKNKKPESEEEEDSDSEYELSESESEEEIEYQYVIQPKDADAQSLAVRGSKVYLNGVPVSRDELIQILSYPPRKMDQWDYALIGGAALGVFAFSLWLSLLSCSLWKINHQ